MSDIQSFLSLTLNDLDLTAVIKPPFLQMHAQTSGGRYPFIPDTTIGAGQPYYIFVEMLNKKDGLISELPNPDQFEDFLDEDARSYDGKKLSKVERFPQYYILEVDTSDAGEKRKQPK